tara:strand:+ start:567 stop:914 length:348 start_codon:yes stop_codon:yes gene_type:complete
MVREGIVQSLHMLLFIQVIEEDCSTLLRLHMEVLCVTVLLCVARQIMRGNWQKKKRKEKKEKKCLRTLNYLHPNDYLSSWSSSSVLCSSLYLSQSLLDFLYLVTPRKKNEKNENK